MKGNIIKIVNQSADNLSPFTTLQSMVFDPKSEQIFGFNDFFVQSNIVETDCVYVDPDSGVTNRMNVFHMYEDKRYELPIASSLNVLGRIWYLLMESETKEKSLFLYTIDVSDWKNAKIVNRVNVPKGINAIQYTHQ